MCRIQNQIKYRNNVCKQKITSKIYDIDTYFYEHYKERIRFDKFFAAIYENGHTNRDPIFEKNETNSTRKKPWLQI